MQVTRELSRRLRLRSKRDRTGPLGEYSCPAVSFQPFLLVDLSMNPLVPDTPLSETIVSRESDVGILINQVRGATNEFDRDSTAMHFSFRVLGRHAPARVAVLFSQSFISDLRPATIGIYGLAREEALFACALARVGDFIDEVGTAHLIETRDRIEVQCLSYNIEAWRNRQPATEEQVVAYFAAKVDWAWRYDQASTTAVASDTIRLRVPWNTIQRMAQLGDGIYWRRDPESAVFVPEPSALRARRSGITHVNKGDQSILLLLRGLRYEGPRAQWEKALGFLHSDRPDPANAAKEAICAVEGLARIVVGRHTATLGDLIKDLRSRFGLNPAIVKSIEGIWGYTNNASGVRHGATSEVGITLDSARFVVDSAEAI